MVYGIARRASELVPPPAPVAPEPSVEPALLPAAPALPLPEAPASVNVRLTIDGREVQLTLRDTDEARLLARLQAVLAQYPVPQPPAPPAPSQAQLSPQQHNAAAMHRRVTDFCPVHNIAMQRHENANGVWYSHYVDGAHCKGKGRRS